MLHHQVNGLIDSAPLPFTKTFSLGDIYTNNKIQKYCCKNMSAIWPYKTLRENAKKTIAVVIVVKVMCTQSWQRGICYYTPQLPRSQSSNEKLCVYVCGERHTERDPWDCKCSNAEAQPIMRSQWLRPAINGQSYAVTSANNQHEAHKQHHHTV